MARVTIYTTDGGNVDIQKMPDEDAMTLIEEWTLGESPLTVTLDGNGSSHIAGSHITRIDIDGE